METEKALVKKILSGDLSTFKDLVDMYQKLVVHVIFRLISRQEDREEICQEVFIKVYKNLSTFKFQSKLSTWIGKIAYTTAINYLRKEKLSGFSELKEISEIDESGNEYDHPLRTIQSEELNPLENLERQELSAFIQKKINTLPAPYQMILTLYHLEEMSYQEIGEIMELPDGTVKSYLFRGRKKLKASLVRELEGEEII